MRDRDNFRGKQPTENKACSAPADIDSKYDEFLDRVVRKFPDLKGLKASGSGSRR